MNRLAVKQYDLLIYTIALLASVVISLFVDFNDNLINPDAVCYLSSAEAMGRLGLKGAMHLCGQANWPFYPVLIYGFAKISYFSYPVAAYLLDAIFSMGSVAAFILIVKALGGTRRVLWLAAATILLAHQFNSVREYIIRDHGFWSFYLISLYFLLRYIAAPRALFAILWSSSLLIATLFRIEGAVFLLALPFICWLDAQSSWFERAKRFAALYLPVLAMSAFLIMWLAAHPDRTVAQLGRVAELTYQLQHGVAQISQRYLDAKIGLAAVLGKDSAHEAGTVLVLLLLAWYVFNVIQNVSWPYAILAMYGWLKKIVRFDRQSTYVVLGYLIINILITAAFLLEHFFLSKRYLIALSLILMLWVPFVLAYLLQAKRYVLFALAGLCMIVSAQGGLINRGYSKAYIANAGEWLAQHVPANASLYANDYQLMYYSRHFGDGLFEKIRSYADINMIADGKWKQYDYLAVRLNKKNPGQTLNLLQAIPLRPMQSFENKRGDQVVIYKVLSEEKVS